MLNPQTESIDVIAAGHLCLDLLPTFVNSELCFAPGTLLEVGKAVMSTGGSVSNTGLALHILGIKVQLMGKVGDDLFGQAIKDILNSYGPTLTLGLTTSPGEQTSYSIILSPPGRDRMFLHAPGCNATFTRRDVDFERVAKARIFHFGYPPLMKNIFRNGGTELISLFKTAKSTGVTTSLDMSFPDLSSEAGNVDWEQILTDTLPYVDIFLPSVEELFVMLRLSEYVRLKDKFGSDGFIDSLSEETVSSLGEQLLRMGVKVAAIKLGHRGIYLRTAGAEAMATMGQLSLNNPLIWSDRELWSPCYEVDVVGTTGSGDATIAGFLMGLLRDMSPNDTLKAASAVGGCCVEAPDSLGGLHGWEKISQRIAHGWRRLDAHVSSTTWDWSDSLGVLTGPSDSHSLQSSLEANCDRQ